VVAGYLRATRDVEIVPDPEPDNLTRLADLLVTLNGRVELEEGALRPDAIATFLRAGERTLVSTDLGQLDVLQGLPQVPPSPSWRRTRRRRTSAACRYGSARSMRFSR
jgi:hypothetical protein